MKAFFFFLCCFFSLSVFCECTPDYCNEYPSNRGHGVLRHYNGIYGVKHYLVCPNYGHWLSGLADKCWNQSSFWKDSSNQKICDIVGCTCCPTGECPESSVCEPVTCSCCGEVVGCSYHGTLDMTGHNVICSSPLMGGGTCNTHYCTDSCPNSVNHASDCPLCGNPVDNILSHNVTCNNCGEKYCGSHVCQCQHPCLGKGWTCEVCNKVFCSVHDNHASNIFTCLNNVKHSACGTPPVSASAKHLVCSYGHTYCSACGHDCDFDPHPPDPGDGSGGDGSGGDGSGGDGSGGDGSGGDGSGGDGSGGDGSDGDLKKVVDSIDSTLDDTNIKLDSVDSTVLDISNKLDIANNHLEDSNEILKSIDSGIAESNDILNSIDSGVAESNVILDSIDLGISESNDKLDSIDSRLQQSNDSLDLISDNIVDINDGVSRANDTLDSLDSSVSSIEDGVWSIESAFSAPSNLGEVPEAELTERPEWRESLDLITKKLLPDFDLPSSGSKDFSLRVPLDLRFFGGGDYSFDISGWWSAANGQLFWLASIMKAISYFIFSLIFVFGIVRALRQW